MIASSSFGATASTTESSPVIGQAPYRAAVLASAPSGYWRLDEASGSIAVDPSGSGRDGRCSGTGVTYRVADALSEADPAVSFASASASASFVDVGDTLDFGQTESFSSRRGCGPSLPRHGRAQGGREGESDLPPGLRRARQRQPRRAWSSARSPPKIVAHEPSGTAQRCQR